MPTDPVCGMTVDEKTAAGTLAYHGTTWYFCSPTCLHQFEANPASFIAAEDRSTPLEGKTETAPGMPAKAATPAEPIPATRGVTLNWMASFYDRLCTGVGLGEGFRQETLRYAALRPGERVLDVGCGTGVLTRMAAEAVGPAGWVVGIDPAPLLLARARDNAALAGKWLAFRLAAVEHLPFVDQTFDVVLASFVLHHLPPAVKRAGLHEVYRVLKPGGRLLVVDVDWSQARPWWWILGWPLALIPMLRDHWAGQLSSYFVQAGFRPVEAVGRWRWCWGFWVAHRPSAEESGVLT